MSTADSDGPIGGTGDGGEGDGGAGEIIERAATPEGQEITLARRGTAFDIRLDGKVIVSSDRRRSEVELARLALAPMGQRDDTTVLVAGLGMGHTLRAVLDLAGVVRVDVVELSEQVVAWNRKYFGPTSREALADPRVHIHTGELLGFLKRVRYEPIEAVKDGWLAILLDVDEGPGGLSRPENQSIYAEEGLSRIEAALRHGGVLAVWSPRREVPLLQAMHARLVNVAELIVPVDVDGKTNLDYIYRGRRPPERKVGGKIAQA